MGGISDVGMAAKDSHARRALRAKGINLLVSTAALAGLDYQIRNNITEMVCYKQTNKKNKKQKTKNKKQKTKKKTKKEEFIGFICEKYNLLVSTALAVLDYEK
jgi:hypothetical protein